MYSTDEFYTELKVTVEVALYALKLWSVTST